MLGYWDEDKKNQEAFTPDRFYRTGLIIKIKYEFYICLIKYY